MVIHVVGGLCKGASTTKSVVHLVTRYHFALPSYQAPKVFAAVAWQLLSNVLGYASKTSCRGHLQGFGDT